MAEETLAYRAIARVDRQVRAVKGSLGPDVRLVVLPEYFLTGCPLRESIPEWAGEASLDPDGAEYEPLAKIAEDDAVYLSGNVYETDAALPDLYFQASFVIDPSGATVLRYRRLASRFAPTPHDVRDRYLERDGLDVATRARAIENRAYVVSASTGGFLGANLPALSMDGLPKVVDYLGEARADSQQRRER